MNICLFTEEEINRPLSIKDERGEHLIKILHKKEGDSFAAGIIGGMAGKAVITSVEKREVVNAKGKSFYEGEINFTFEPQTDGKQLNNLIMIIGFPRPIQLKRLLRDMAGLGVKEVHLTATELTEKSYLESDLSTSDAGYKMLLEGTVQAASTHVPALFRHDSLEECVDYIKSHGGSENLFALDNINPCGSVTGYIASKTAGGGAVECAVAAVGSERGWTENERRLLEEKGFVRLSMGPRVLRTETAATVAASIILSGMGVL